MSLPSAVRRSRRGLREAALLGALFFGYELLRAFGRTDVDGAVDRGWWLVRWQTALGVPSEVGLQRLALPHDVLVAALNNYYVWVHFPGTALFLVWLWRRHHRRYAHMRSVLVAMTSVGLLLQALVPVAPPRLLPGAAFVDTMAVVGPSAYGSDAAATLANQYAAFPSLHVGWALLVAYGVWQASSRRLRWLAWLHPILTVLVVVTTANHYWTDAAAAGMLLAVAVAAPAWLRVLCQRLPGRRCEPVLA